MEQNEDIRPAASSVAEPTQAPSPVPMSEDATLDAPPPSLTDADAAPDAVLSPSDVPCEEPIPQEADQLVMNLGVSTASATDHQASPPPEEEDGIEAPDVEDGWQPEQYTLTGLSPAEPTAEALDEAVDAEECEETESQSGASSCPAPPQPRLRDRLLALAEQDGASHYDPDRPRRVDGFFDFVELFIFTLVLVLLLTSFFFRHSVVDGGSMLNTLHDGEHLITSDLFYTPQRGDIVVCEVELRGQLTRIIKRVIAVSGDRVVIREGAVFVNGERLEENYVYLDVLYYRYEALDITVPEGEIFVMGDHRNNSTDSREFGCVREDAVLGKVIFRFFPFDKWGTV